MQIYKSFFTNFAVMANADRRIDIMGIVNLTDDSYYAPSRCSGEDPVEQAAERIRSMVSEGAGIIDIGASSSRPGAHPVSAQEEWARLEPVLRKVAGLFPDVVISIDTWHSEVITGAYRLFCDIMGEEAARNRLMINDISAGEDDPQMLVEAGRLGLSYVAMHKRGNPMTMQSLCSYDDVVSEVGEYFRAFAMKAERYGIRDWVLDPGFGFAKTVDQNYELLCGLDRLGAGESRRILVGVSRKSMIYKPLSITPEDALPATQVLHLKALQMGADILRVHDVAEASRTVELYRRLR